LVRQMADMWVEKKVVGKVYRTVGWLAEVAAA
jgi:hypothetical protein